MIHEQVDLSSMATWQTEEDYIGPFSGKTLVRSGLLRDFFILTQGNNLKYWTQIWEESYPVMSCSVNVL